MISDGVSKGHQCTIHHCDAMIHFEGPQKIHLSGKLLRNLKFSAFLDSVRLEAISTATSFCSQVVRLQTQVQL